MLNSKECRRVIHLLNSKGGGGMVLICKSKQIIKLRSLTFEDNVLNITKDCIESFESYNQQNESQNTTTFTLKISFCDETKQDEINQLVLLVQTDEELSDEIADIVDDDDVVLTAETPSVTTTFQPTTKDLIVNTSATTQLPKDNNRM